MHVKPGWPIPRGLRSMSYPDSFFEAAQDIQPANPAPAYTIHPDPLDHLSSIQFWQTILIVPEHRDPFIPYPLYPGNSDSVRIQTHPLPMPTRVVQAEITIPVSSPYYPLPSLSPKSLPKGSPIPVALPLPVYGNSCIRELNGPTGPYDTLHCMYPLDSNLPYTVAALCVTPVFLVCIDMNGLMRR